jgi:hypothetical protein
MTLSARRKAALEYLRSIYRYDSATGTYTIDIRLPDYDYAFSLWTHAWDEVPEANPGLVQYLKDCSDDIPFRAPIQIVFGIEASRHEEKEARLTDSIRKYFRYELFIERRKIRRLLSRVMQYIVVSFSLLTAGLLLEAFIADHLLLRIIHQGLFVGGWVFLWEAIHQFSFQQSSLRRTVADYRRFLEAEIRFETAR